MFIYIIPVPVHEKLVWALQLWHAPASGAKSSHQKRHLAYTPTFNLKKIAEIQYEKIKASDHPHIDKVEEKPFAS